MSLTAQVDTTPSPIDRARRVRWCMAGRTVAMTIPRIASMLPNTIARRHWPVASRQTTLVCALDAIVTMRYVDFKTIEWGYVLRYPYTSHMQEATREILFFRVADGAAHHLWHDRDCQRRQR